MEYKLNELSQEIRIKAIKEFYELNIDLYEWEDVPFNLNIDTIVNDINTMEIKFNSIGEPL